MSYGLRPAGRRDTAVTGRSRWHRLYFLLAAFDLFTVLLSLGINHEIRGIYTQSVEVNQIWGQRLADYSALGQLAAAVNGPGNDVFDSHDVATEEQRLETALSAFELRLGALREEVRTHANPTEAARLAEDFDSVATAMREMTEEAQRRRISSSPTSRLASPSWLGVAWPRWTASTPV
jgi:hypothetical protein